MVIGITKKYLYVQKNKKCNLWFDEAKRGNEDEKNDAKFSFGFCYVYGTNCGSFMQRMEWEFQITRMVRLR